MTTHDGPTNPAGDGTPARTDLRSIAGSGLRAVRESAAGYRYIDLIDPQLFSSVGTGPQLVYTAALRIRPEIPQPASL